MVNQDYKETMELKGREYNLVPGEFLPTGDKFIISKGNRIPFNACFTGLGRLRIASGLYLFGRLLDTDSILKLFVSGSHILHVNIRRHRYYVGKGILLDQNMKVLAMLTVSEEFYHHFRNFGELTDEHIQKHFTLVIGKEFETSTEHRTLHAKFRKNYRAAACNKSFVAEPEYESFTRVTLPAFPTLAQRQAFMDNLTGEVVSELLTSQVMIA